ncbi:hypothetical protein [Vannielia litorea]|uniref:Secreted protein n=1 Tax=Vannielia litorea TaxID=1217970 RepID=A0A1N6ENT9_9RHOB|nr:hypothetical protein [Vannielia litorea]SIN84752.1 hypothetical protein SAMN05444002_0974 [Vannielia litorea]
MTVKFVKPMMAAAAVSMVLVAPASAQIAKFHVMAPAIPGLSKLDRISSSDDAASEFLGSTGDMAKETSASLSEMRESEEIVAREDQQIDDSTRQDDRVADRAPSDSNGGGNDGERITPPLPRPDLLAAADLGTTVTTRPETGKQVIVRTRTKSPRGGSKIKTGAIWSVGEFR